MGEQIWGACQSHVSSSPCPHLCLLPCQAGISRRSLSSVPSIMQLCKYIIYNFPDFHSLFISCRQAWSPQPGSCPAVKDRAPPFPRQQSRESGSCGLGAPGTP